MILIEVILHQGVDDNSNNALLGVTTFDIGIRVTARFDCGLAVIIEISGNKKVRVENLDIQEYFDTLKLGCPMHGTTCGQK